MASPIATIGEQQDGAVFEFSEQVTYLNRHTPRYYVEVETRSFFRLGFNQLVESIVVEEHDDKAPLAVVRLNNSGGKFTDNLVFQTGKKLFIATGWANTRLVDRGRFVIYSPTFKFGFEGREVVELVAYGEVTLLAAQGQKRREWKGLTDTQIVTQLAKEYSMEIEADPTTTVHDLVLQANENDAQFIRRLATRNGFQFFVRGVRHGKSLLHFHKLRSNLWEEKVVLQYRGETKSSIGYIEVSADTLQSAREVRATQIDPLSGELISVASRNILDDVSRRTQVNARRDATPLRDWTKLVRTDAGTLPVEYMSGTDQPQTKDDLYKRVESHSQASRFLVRGFSSGIGAESVRAGSLVSILGIDKFSGIFYVKSVVHRIDQSGYTVDLDIKRTSIQDKGSSDAFGKDRLPDDISNELPIERTGTVDARGNIQLDPEPDIRPLAPGEGGQF